MKTADYHVTDRTTKNLAMLVLKRKQRQIAGPTLVLGAASPGLGYEHLVDLVAEGLITSIIATSTDNILEQSLAAVIPLDQMKVFIRGETPDELIAQALSCSFPSVRVIKLYGDSMSNTLFFRGDNIPDIAQPLMDALRALLCRGSIVVGQNAKESDLIKKLFSARCDTVYYVDDQRLPEESDLYQVLSAATYGRGPHIISEENGKFDTFFAALNMEAQRRYIKSKSDERARTESDIIERQEKGTGYINCSTLTRMIKNFTGKIKTRFAPDFVVFIHDPAASGGMELKRRMSGLPVIATDTIWIEGDYGTRSLNREVKSAKPNFPDIGRQKKILILDDVGFSGHTLRCAVEKMREWYPKDVVRAGVLILDMQLKEDIDAGNDRLLFDIIFQTLTDRHELFFPWGMVQATGECHRAFKALEAEYPIRISKRPWGTIEILADEQRCSVRILTIEADKTLSFQRHVCRDEFFVSLDENICLELCGGDLESIPEGATFADLPEVKSLVLEKGDYILVPKGIWHRFKASKDRSRLLEVGYGLYDQARDIERRYDAYGRTHKTGDD